MAAAAAAVVAAAGAVTAAMISNEENRSASTSTRAHVFFSEYLCVCIYVHVSFFVNNDAVALLNSVAVVAIEVRKPFPHNPKRS